LIRKRIFVMGMGMISPLGADVPVTLQALYSSNSGLKPLSRFPAPYLLPVGEVPAGMPPAEPLPGTHRYALAAACEAVKGQSEPPESVIVGTTTGGMPLTEEKLRQGVTDPAAYRYHATSSIAETIALKLNCRGRSGRFPPPVLLARSPWPWPWKCCATADFSGFWPAAPMPCAV